MYFANEELKSNYGELMNIYNLTPGQNVQYESNLYLAAFPELYRLINKSQFKPSTGPLVPLMTYSEQEEKMVPSHPGLTGATRWLVEAGFSLYNGNPCDLDYTNSPTFALLFIQAFKIRNKITGLTTL